MTKLNIRPDALGVSSEDVNTLNEADPSEEGEEADVEAGSVEEGAEKPKKRRFRRRVSTKDVEGQLANRFVNLVDILPPLPEKGKFDVSAIKESQYFFS